MRDSFVFYRSFYESIKELEPIIQAEIYNAIFEYSLNFNLIELTGISKSIFTLIKPQIDANNKKYLNGKLGAEHGNKGGRPKNNPKETPKEPLNNPKETPNVNDNVNDNVNIYKEENLYINPDEYLDYQPVIPTNDFTEIEFLELFNKYRKNNNKDIEYDIPKLQQTIDKYNFRNYKDKDREFWSVAIGTMFAQNNMIPSCLNQPTHILQYAEKYYSAGIDAKNNPSKKIIQLYTK